MAQFQIRKAERSQSKLRVGLAGPSGAGKTMSALKLARGLVGETGRILMIDTERGSGDLYAHLTDYDIITLQPPYAPKNYCDAIEAGEDAGYDAIIIDSLSHAWADEGGLLDQADKMSAGGNRFTVWANLTPQHRRLVNAMLNSDCHIIATVRSKQDYATEKDERTGKTTVKKLGMAPVQRDGMEYEFTVFMDIDQNHIARTSKDRTDLFRDEAFLIDESIGKRLIDWLLSAKAVVHQTNKETRLNQKKQKVAKLLNDWGFETKGIDGAVIREKIKEVTGLEATENNYDEIVSRLGVLVEEKKVAAKQTATEPAKA